MMDALGAIGLPEVVAAIVVLGLTAYAITGGADFGGGVWDLLARGPRKASQRKLISGALAPIWEANHVWLIVVIVVLFTAFPPAFSAIAIALHLPLTALLVGIVLRGSAFVFRAYGGAGHGSGSGTAVYSRPAGGSGYQARAARGGHGPCGRSDRADTTHRRALV